MNEPGGKLDEEEDIETEPEVDAGELRDASINRRFNEDTGYWAIKRCELHE
jgi:hypothetical protein